MNDLKHFSKVREAREALKEKALELHDLHLKIIKGAMDVGDFKTAGAEMRWMREHLPADDDGVTAIDTGIDAAKQIQGSTGPTIKIGFALGGVNQGAKLLPPAQVIEVEPEETN